ncbi:MAG: HD domain-containing protein [Sedimentisphaerales bacterium]|nr:HD domain-containing protein [Sedimentisphaerales bacterium]
MFRCPGQDQRYWKPEDIFEVQCSGCSRKIEFFKDEPKLKCRGCGRIVMNPKIDLGCTEWCQYAEQCLGIVAAKDVNSLCRRLINRAKHVLGTDKKRIDHMLAVLHYAEQIQAEEGGEPLIVKAAAILHDIGIHQAAQKYDSVAGKYQEIEGPPVAREILEELGVDEAAVEHVCRIIANHHSGKDIDTIEFRCVWDADWLVNIPEEVADAEKIRHIIDTVFKTDTGRKIAVETLLGGDSRF